MSFLLVLSKREHFFPLCVRACSANALDCRVIWGKAEKETGTLSKHSPKDHILIMHLSLHKLVSLQQQEQSLIDTVREQVCLLN